MNRPWKKLTLALETGIDGGSAAVLNGESVLCSEQGAGDISQSEDLLRLIDDLLKKNGLLKREIGYVAVSDSPGSATGIRIGLATAVGLKDSLAAEVLKIPILEAQALLSKAEKSVISALYTEKKGIYYCKFRFGEGNYTAECDILNERDPSDFRKMLGMQERTAVLDNKLAELLELSPVKPVPEGFKTHTIGGSPAERIGLASYLIMRPITN